MKLNETKLDSHGGKVKRQLITGRKNFVTGMVLTTVGELGKIFHMGQFNPEFDFQLSNSHVNPMN